MKAKNLFIALLGLMATVSSCSKDDENDEKKENTNITDGVAAPPYAASDKQWIIENNTLHIRQIWSDVIAIPACNKTAFDGGNYPTYKADCRNNPGYAGYLYSWNYVNENAANLCPSPWRVPSTDDFINLDKAFGGNDHDTTAERNYGKKNYSNAWGGSHVGYAYSHWLGEQGSSAFYWSSTEFSSHYAYSLFFYDNGVQRNTYAEKDFGYTLRCVR